jgi:hypothetical protein
LIFNTNSPYFKLVKFVNFNLDIGENFGGGYNPLTPPACATGNRHSLRGALSPIEFNLALEKAMRMVQSEGNEIAVNNRQVLTFVFVYDLSDILNESLKGVLE